MKKPIKIELDYLLDFIKKVIFQWVTLLLLLPTSYDFAHVYFPEPIKSFELSDSPRLLFMALAVLAAIYRVWRKEHIALQALQEKKTKFTITPYFFKIKIDKHLQQIDNKIRNLETEIPQLESESIFDRWAVFSRKKTQQSVLEYTQSLEKYKKELMSFYKKNKDLIGVNIELESDKYDENISVEFILKTGKVIQAYELDCPSPPSAPDKDRFHYIRPIDIRERDVYRTNLEYSKTVISCDLRNLKKGQPALFINEGIYIDSKTPKVSFELHITSKNSDGLQTFSFNEEKTNITEHKDISELEEFDREL